MKHILDNTQTQKVFTEALQILGEPATLETQMLVNYLQLFAVYSNSGNNIPSLKGLGLEDAIEVARNIITNPYAPPTRINFKQLSKIFHTST